jgi:hypothetical protein
VFVTPSVKRMPSSSPSLLCIGKLGKKKEKKRENTN